MEIVASELFTELFTDVSVAIVASELCTELFTDVSVAIVASEFRVVQNM